MKPKEKTFGDLNIGDEFYVVEMEFGFLTKRKVLDTREDVNGMIQLIIVDTSSTNYECDSHAISFPKDFSLYGPYATTIESAKEFVKHWKKAREEEIEKKVNRMMDLLNSCEL